MKRECPKCHSSNNHVIKSGFFVRKSDSKKIQRYKCLRCFSHFSSATFSACYMQKKRRINPILRNSLCSSMSMRRFAKIYCVSRTTVQRKLKFLASQARLSQEKWLSSRKSSFQQIQFDDLETFEHTKCKPITVSVFVEAGSRKIIDFSVARIGAKGLLAKPARKKYGLRKNEALKKRSELFKRVSKHVHTKAFISTDENQFYPPLVKTFFPKATHKRYKGAQSSLGGQGELKKQSYDPIFSINHTFAMMRYGVNRLIRKTWCTTKCINALEDHLALYVDFHNQVLTG